MPMRAGWKAGWLLVATLLAHCYSADPTSTTDDDDVQRDDDAGAQPPHDAEVAGDGASAGPDAGAAGDASASHDAGNTTQDAAPGDDEFGPPPAQNPFTAADGLATQHGDSAASDTSPLPGPGIGVVRGQRVDLLAACPSLFVTSRGRVLAVCTQIINQSPAVFLLDAEQGTTLASLQIVGGDLFGGVYPYLDAQDRLLVVDGTNRMLRVAVHDTPPAAPMLTLDGSVSLADMLVSDCGRPSCDSVVGLAPDYDGRIWFATQAAKVGTIDFDAQRVQLLALQGEERVANSIATAPEGTAVVTDHALYLLRADAQGAPQIAFRAPYDRGSARKPGQLSHGSGSTPTFFGPRTGSEYLTIFDNAQPSMNLLVYRAQDGELLCEQRLPEPAGLASESSPIGSGRSVFVSSSYGYPYPALPRDAEPSEPASAPLRGGMVRIDVNANERGCQVVWNNEVRSAAVPKLSLADQRIYTIERQPQNSDGSAGFLDAYAYVAIDPVTGEVLARQPLPDLADTMQLAGTIAPDGVLLQGTIFGYMRISPAN